MKCPHCGSEDPKTLEKRDLQKACEKRPVTVEKMVGARRIGDLVAQYLKGVDRMAYAQYVAVFRSFEEIEDFQKLVEEKYLSPKVLQGKNESKESIEGLTRALAAFNFARILGSTAKHDDDDRMIAFLLKLLAYSKDCQTNSKRAKDCEALFGLHALTEVVS